MPQNNRYNTLKNQDNARKKSAPSLAAYLIAIVFAALPMQASAFTAESNEPIKIQSDHAELDELNGLSVYTGDVVVTQGTTLLSSDKVIVYSDKTGLIKLEAFGSPAKFSHQQEGESAPTHAYGKTIIYTRASETLTLIDEAKLEQGKNTFRGATIEYNTVSRVVTAESGEDKSQRVEMIVHPVKKDTGDKKE